MVLPMKYLLIVLAVVSLFFLSLYSRSKKNVPVISRSRAVTPTPLSTLSPLSQETKSLFVAYWNVELNQEDLQSYSSLYYFGVAPSSEGRLIADQGRATIEEFANHAEGKDTYLVVRMLDSRIAQGIIKNKETSRTLINETLSIAKQYRFKGIALDIEIFNILDESVRNDINSFVQLYSFILQDNNLELVTLLYGDVFFRHRPYDVEFIGKHSDKILVMAYDFHKAIGEPGPNFPLSGRSKYGYDFQQMIDDFVKIVPAEKLGVIFGMYGYEWSVDEKKRPLKQARALSLKDIQKEFVEECTWKNCLVRRDPESAETEVNYVTEVEDPSQSTESVPFYRLLYHIVWFEDEESVRQKTKHVLSKGVGETAYWVWGYFEP